MAKKKDQGVDAAAAMVAAGNPFPLLPSRRVVVRRPMTADDAFEKRYATPPAARGTDDLPVLPLRG